MPFFSLPSGASPVLAGTSPPTGGIGVNGDLFIDTANKLLYGPKAGGAWPSGINLSNGPTGSIGTTGPTGSTGPTGVTGGIAFAATGPTAPGITAPGGIWLDAATGKYFVAYQGLWIEIGVQGERGPTGVTGAASNVTGPVGVTGPPSAVTGPTGGYAFAATGPTAPNLTQAGAVWLDTATGKYFVRYEYDFIEIGVQGEQGPAGSFASAQDINPRVTGHTLALADAGKLLTIDVTGAVQVVIPAFANVAFPTGTHVDLVRLNTGTVLVTGATGVTVNGAPGTSLRAQYSAATCIHYDGDKWVVVGDLS